MLLAMQHIQYMRIFFVIINRERYVDVEEGNVLLHQRKHGTIKNSAINHHPHHDYAEKVMKQFMLTLCSHGNVDAVIRLLEQAVTSCVNCFIVV